MQKFNLCSRVLGGFESAGGLYSSASPLHHSLDFDPLEKAMQSVYVPLDEVKQHIQKLHTAWDEKKMDDMVDELRKKIFHCIAGPFGVGKIVAAWDKTGGNVTTVHNAKQKIYAKEEQRYDRDEYCGGQYQDKSRAYRDRKIGENFTTQDEYTGKTHNYKNVRNRASLDCDHIKSCGQYHAEGGFIQNTAQRRAFAEDEGNFAVTAPSINSSMGEKDKLEWANTPNSTSPSKTNAEYYDVDMEKLEAAHERGEKTAEKHAPTRCDWAKYYGRELALTGAGEAGKQGVVQALGLLLMDFFEAAFVEIRGSWKNGIAAGVGESSMLDGLAARLKRVIKTVLANWRKVFIAFRDGALGAFLSNMLTTFINVFITTGKRLVRMIREGFFSFLQAAKLILFRSEGMSMAEAADAALKLLVGGGVICGGIILEEALEKSLMASLAAVPVLNLLAPQIIAVLAGGLTATCGALAMYGLERLDFFAVNAKKRHEFIMGELDASIKASDAAIEKSIADAGIEFVTEIGPQGEQKIIARRCITLRA